MVAAAVWPGVRSGCNEAAAGVSNRPLQRNRLAFADKPMSSSSINQC